MASTTVLLVDDHEIVRCGLRTILETDENLEIAGEAENGREAVRMAAELEPDVVVMDISMPELNGLEAVRQIRNRTPRTEVLVLTMHESEDLIRKTLEAGARGYLLKSDAARLLVPAIQTLRRHEPFFTSKASQVVLDGFLGDRKRLRGETARALTSRETEVLQLLSEGRTNKEVAATLHISAKTVETHRANIMRKLGAQSVSELVRYAVRNHIIEP